jgi:hypothetical protein
MPRIRIVSAFNGPAGVTWDAGEVHDASDLTARVEVLNGRAVLVGDEELPPAPPLTVKALHMSEPAVSKLSKRGRK